MGHASFSCSSHRGTGDTMFFPRGLCGFVCEKREFCAPGHPHNNAPSPATQVTATIAKPACAGWIPAVEGRLRRCWLQLPFSTTSAYTPIRFSPGQFSGSRVYSPQFEEPHAKYVSPYPQCNARQHDDAVAFARPGRLSRSDIRTFQAATPAAFFSSWSLPSPSLAPPSA